MAAIRVAGLIVLSVVQVAAVRLGNFHAGGGGQPQLPCHGGKGIYTQLPPDIVKKDVAAVFQSGAQIDRAAVAVLQAAGW